MEVGIFMSSRGGMVGAGDSTHSAKTLNSDFGVFGLNNIFMSILEGESCSACIFSVIIYVKR